jgi:Glycosyl hydrolases family 38 N-terminal domain
MQSHEHGNRRQFLMQLAGLVALPNLETNQGAPSAAYFTIVNHMHQAGIGFLYRRGFVRNRRYREAYSVFYDVQKTFDLLEQWPELKVCLDFDSYAYEVMADEDAAFVYSKLKGYVDTGRIELVGGTYSQPFPEVISWLSNILQYVEGRSVVRKIFGREVDSFIAEEIAFHPQMPQLLRLCGFAYASLEIQNTGEVRRINRPLIRWRGLDGTEIPAIPQNDLLIPVPEQYKSFSEAITRSRKYEQPLITLWVEIWPPGGDWGASYTPYTKGFESIRSARIEPITLTGYMRRRCAAPAMLPSEYVSMDDGKFEFNRWAGLGGCGYQGELVLTSLRQREHALRAAELLLGLDPNPERQEKLDRLWKKYMVAQNHDLFIVAGFPAEYNQVITTNLEAGRMIQREVNAGIVELRNSLYESLEQGTVPVKADHVIVQNATALDGIQPILFEYEAVEGHNFVLSDGQHEFPVQAITPDAENDTARFMALVPLRPYSFRSYELRKANLRMPSEGRQTGKIANEFYRVRWDPGASAFAVEDIQLTSHFLFRPFAGEIIKVNETLWAASNNGEKFRAKNFSELSFTPVLEVSGAAFSALRVRANILTLNTTEDIPAWVTAEAVVYPGIRRVDFRTELSTYHQMAFHAFSELESAAPASALIRDFPFGEEESRRPEFSSLHYVRIESPDQALALAHDGTQQFFVERRGATTVLRNVIARETLRGYYQWHWSITCHNEMTPGESLLFAQVLFPAIVRLSKKRVSAVGPVLSTDDPATAVFRFVRRRERTEVWLMNYSSRQRDVVLEFSHSYRAVKRTDFEGNTFSGPRPALVKKGQQVRLKLRAWEIAALALSG